MLCCLGIGGLVRLLVLGLPFGPRPVVQPSARCLFIGLLFGPCFAVWTLTYLFGTLVLLCLRVCFSRGGLLIEFIPNRGYFGIFFPYLRRYFVYNLYIYLGYGCASHDNGLTKIFCIQSVYLCLGTCVPLV